MIVKQKITRALEQAAKQAQKKGKLTFAALPEVIVERPQNTEHGDYASSLALKLSREAGLAPLSIANTIIEFLPSLPEIVKTVVAIVGVQRVSAKQPSLRYLKIYTCAAEFIEIDFLGKKCLAVGIRGGKNHRLIAVIAYSSESLGSSPDYHNLCLHLMSGAIYGPVCLKKQDYWVE